MVFSSSIFLFGFLPIVLALYYIAPQKLRNGVLLLASLMFYFWSEQKLLLVLLGSVLTAYVFGLLIDGAKSQGGRKLMLILSLGINLGCCFAINT
jgi:alginate O-acetyltransferase complex protein AlgI